MPKTLLPIFTCLCHSQAVDTAYILHFDKLACYLTGATT